MRKSDFTLPTLDDLFSTQAERDDAKLERVRNIPLAELHPFKGHFGRVTRKDRDFFRDALAQLDMGLEDRMNTPVGLLSGGQRQALTLLMASLQKPKLLLLDEHTAALDPATAKKVLDISDSIIRENGLTALMITHNMKDAINHGTRLIMMNEGHIILDVEGEEKKKLTKQQLMEKFAEIAGKQVESDRILLS